MQQKNLKAHKHTQNVYINTHCPQRAQSSVHKSNPFKNNAPQNKGGISSNETVNPNVVQQISQLQKHMQKKM